MEKITLSDCLFYDEDPYVCYDCGDPKGQCRNCGAKWYEHDIRALPDVEIASAQAIQAERGIVGT